LNLNCIFDFSSCLLPPASCLISTSDLKTHQLTGYQPQQNCFVTVSLSLPYSPSANWEGEAPCWKLIAGVIEL